MSTIVALVTVVLIAAFAALTGLPRRYELGRAYAGLLMHIEASARELRADYCARANMEFAARATRVSLTSLVRKRPGIAFVAFLVVLFSTMAMSVTGGAPKPYEIREVRAALARLMGDAGEAEALEAQNRISPLVWRDPPETAARPADIDLALLGSDLLGGPEEELLGASAP